MRSISRPLAIALTTALSLAAASRSDAQSLELDVETFLTSENAFTERMSSNVWSFKAPSARQLILLPLKPAQINAPIELSERAVDVSGSRLIGWYIPPIDWAIGGNLVDREKGERAPAGTRNLEVLTPRVSRDVVLNPDGTIEWKMARALLDGKASSKDNAYALRIDRSMLDRPERPDIPPRRANEPTAKYVLRRNKAVTEFRERIETYTAINKLLTSLPTEFKQNTPSRIIAIFDGSVLMKELIVSGTECTNWTVPYDTFTLARKLARGSGTDADVERVLGTLVPAGDPTSLRAAAVVIAAKGNLKKLADDSPAIAHIESVMKRGDSRSKVLVAQAIARDPAKIAVAGQLLDVALSNPDPQVVLLGLKGKLSEQSGNPDESTLRTLTQTVNALLSGSNEADPAEVLQVCFDLIEDQPTTLDALAEQVELNSTAPNRREAMVTFVVGRAAEGNSLANAWLGDQILKPSAPDLARIALRLIPTLVELAAQEQPARGEVRFPLDKESHGLFALIESDDASLQTAAVAAFPSFVVQPPSELAETQVPILYNVVAKAALKVTPTPESFALMLSQQTHDQRGIALGQIAAEGEGPGRLAAMEALAECDEDAIQSGLANVDPNVRVKLMRYWYETEAADDGPRAKPLPGFAGLAAHVMKQWQKADGETAEAPNAPPLVVEFLVHENKNVVMPIIRMIAAKMTHGLRPHPRDWAVAYKSDKDLFEAANSDNPKLARGAAAILVSRVDWPKPSDVANLLKRIEAEAAAALLSADTTAAETAWNAVRAELVQRVRGRVAGAYQVLLKQDATSRFEAISLDLGGVTLQADPLADAVTSVEGTLSGQVKDSPFLTISFREPMSVLMRDEESKSKISWPGNNTPYLPTRDGGWVAYYIADRKPTVVIRLVRTGDAPAAAAPAGAATGL